MPEEAENVSEADKDLNSLLMEHGLVDAMSVSTYHTHTQSATEPVEVRNNLIFSLPTHSQLIKTRALNDNHKG